MRARQQRPLPSYVGWYLLPPNTSPPRETIYALLALADARCEHEPEHYSILEFIRKNGQLCTH